MRYRTLTAAMAAALIGSLGMTTDTYAVEVPPSTEYTAHFCQSNENTIEYSWSRVYNTSSTAEVTFHCPILNTWSGRIGWMVVKVVDQSYDRNISCTVKNLLSNEYYATGWWDTQSSSGSGATVQTLSFGTIGGTGTYHHFTMNCEVPRTYSGNRSSINAYRVYED